MRVRIELTFVMLMLCGFAVCGLHAQDKPRHRSSSNAGPSNTVRQDATDDQQQDNDLQLNDDDRLSLIAAALDARVRRDSEHDCSHLVHAIYQQAGFPYAYAPSSDLYAGVEGFQRVKQPEPGDLIVWRGHAGIVVQPSKHIFFSFMTSGPGTDDYESPYWKRRGHPRFYRYIKNDSCPGCSAPQPSRRVLKIKK
jgi:cell wall-associated NlpC family hydrolase